MAPFSQARTTELLYKRRDGTAVYRAHIDVQWSVFGNPHGGYLLAVIIDALSKHQAESNLKPHHPDPAHLMTQFLQGTKPGRAEIHVKVLRIGKSWTNLRAELYQEGSLVITSLALYTVMPSLPLSPTPEPFSTVNQTLLPLTPSPYAPLTPFVTHPALCDPTPQSDEVHRRWSSNSVFWFLPERIKWAEDLGIKARREGKAEGQQKGESLKLEWGAWCEMTDEGEEADHATLPFWADMMSSIPELFPPRQRVDPHYYPTLSLSLQFHCRLPLPPSSPYLASPRTVGCYSHGSVIQQGRHEQLVEVWSAPGPIGEGEVQDEWRKRCVPLLTSTQIALSVGTGKMAGRTKPSKL
ncbi:thioesterase-like superfamily-domain-containing protein [Leucosporidium creatinivorum]|uniref:Thioesterase-like superfamily-domain-containing protein n=1 Tax=Leucosporidium creatinivorum TaxID=106004 RepID=A0A1Y2FU16_9BASI|nr:thioesterase-like superfamily-domain-containing protein [Leucosporidium creatinivorum]